MLKVSSRGDPKKRNIYEILKDKKGGRKDVGLMQFRARLVVADSKYMYLVNSIHEKSEKSILAIFVRVVFLGYSYENKLQRKKNEYCSIHCIKDSKCSPSLITNVLYR